MRNDQRVTLPDAALPKHNIQVEHTRTPTLTMRFAAKDLLCGLQQLQQLFGLAVCLDNSCAIGEFAL